MEELLNKLVQEIKEARKIVAQKAKLLQFKLRSRREKRSSGGEKWSGKKKKRKEGEENI